MNFLIGIICIIIGVLNLAKPEFAWYLKEGWKVDGDSEPSDTYLTLTRISGGVAIFVGILVFFVGIS
ncbi:MULTISPECIES: DUF6199 family natural product biosynthesis protein [unclassified Paenibacillus]|uniref:DUF6199 family natural product biosynthesis protein n=1 Tax=unclassified Paenibacillus TaxID=185978 RepID=UPI000838E3DF|nr:MULTISPECIES: DUF6199 family natural product biosynthesis protein [unclassified Paenibacillus]NWL90162.1 hypothetical protein [Paenibacillus sp. 79R4]